MKIVLFYHSLVSDWNHGNAHFLRGIMGELILRGHDVTLYEPQDAWSAQNLRAEYGD
jgi:spore maturation protein CgeB